MFDKVWAVIIPGDAVIIEHSLVLAGEVHRDSSSIAGKGENSDIRYHQG